MTKTRAKKKPNTSRRKRFKEIENQWRMMASNFQEIRAGMQKLKEIMDSRETVQEQKKKHERHPSKRKNNGKYLFETGNLCEGGGYEPMKKRRRNEVDYSVSRFASSLKTIYKNPKYIPSSDSIPAPLISHNPPEETQTNISTDSTVYRVTDNDWKKLPTLLAQMTSSSSKFGTNFEEICLSDNSVVGNKVPVTRAGESASESLLRGRTLMHMGDSLAITNMNSEECDISPNCGEDRDPLNPADGYFKVRKIMKSPKSALSYNLIGNLLKTSRGCNELNSLRNSLNTYINKNKQRPDDDVSEYPYPTSSEEQSDNMLSTKGKKFYIKSKNTSDMTSRDQNEITALCMTREDPSPLQDDLSARYGFDSEQSKNSRNLAHSENSVKHKEKQNFSRELVPVDKGRRKLLPYLFFFVISYLLTSIMYVA